MYPIALFHTIIVDTYNTKYIQPLIKNWAKETKKDRKIYTDIDYDLHNKQYWEENNFRNLLF
tara:strand:- start:137 stop:322 length:186 start_codon:yes stop_codon:yes gene_type:complete